MSSQTLRVVSVSLGASTGDFSRRIVLDGHTVYLSREGSDGSMERAADQIRALDGRVDAIGLGGIDMHLWVAGKKFAIGDGVRLAEAATVTPVVDGSGLKNSLERTVVGELAELGIVSPASRVLMVSALDRFGMAEAFVSMGCPCVFGDLIFNIGFDYPLRTLTELEAMAEKYRSRLLTVPFHMLYPTGAAQTERHADPSIAKYYHEADVIAGDGHLIVRHLPEGLEGKGILTNTTRPSSVARFRESGVRWLATTTPDMGGLSGGTNLMEAALVALIGKRPDAIADDEYDEWAARLGWRGSFQYLNGVTEEKS